MTHHQQILKKERDEATKDQETIEGLTEMRNGTHICELSGERWTPAKLRMLSFDRDNWYCASEVELFLSGSAQTLNELCAVAPPSLFGLETCGREPRWLPVRQPQTREFIINEIDIHSNIIRIDCIEMNWEYAFDLETGEMINGLEMARELKDDGARLAEWAIDPSRKIYETYTEVID